jgi:hypothetical protein
MFSNLRGGKVMQVAPETYVMLYPISTLAFECGKTMGTIRWWERHGLFPRAPFKDEINRRRYAKEHIAVTVALVLNEGISSGKAIEKTNFTKKAAQAFESLTIDKLKKCDIEGKPL